MAAPRRRIIVTTRGCCEQTCPWQGMLSCARGFCLGNWDQRRSVVPEVTSEKCRVFSFQDCMSWDNQIYIDTKGGIGVCGLWSMSATLRVSRNDIPPKSIFYRNFMKFHTRDWNRFSQQLGNPSILWIQELISMDSKSLAPEDMRKQRQEQQEKVGYLDERRRCQYGMCRKPWPKGFSLKNWKYVQGILKISKCGTLLIYIYIITVCIILCTSWLQMMWDYIVIAFLLEICKPQMPPQGCWKAGLCHSRGFGLTQDFSPLFWSKSSPFDGTIPAVYCYSCVLCTDNFRPQIHPNNLKKSGPRW